MLTRHGLASIVLLLFTSPLLDAPVLDAAQTRQWASGYAGSLPAEPHNLARTYFERAEVRALLERLESGPLSEVDLVSALAGTDVALVDLLRLKLLRRTEGGYRIGFSYYTRADMEKIHRAADRWVPELVTAYDEKWEDFERIFSSYDVPSVDRDRLAFVLLAGFALNWDALQQTRARGLREPIAVEGDGWQYSFWVSEVDPSYSTKGFIWGSSTAPTEDDNLDPPIDYSFSTFGDPFSYPRMGPPALLWLEVDEMAPEVRAAVERVGLIDESAWGFDSEQVLGFARGRSLGAMLFALREGARTREQLAQTLRAQDRHRVVALIEVLETSGYVAARPDDSYVLTMPVLAERDKPMVEAALALHRQILAAWLRSAYPAIRSELADITALRQGLAFEAVFTQIWHDFFGLATLQLTEAGRIADVYGQDVLHQGWFGALWKHAVYHYEAG